MLPEGSPWIWFGLAALIMALQFLLCRGLWKKPETPDIRQVSPDGKKTAKMILEAEDPSAALEIHDGFLRIPHEERRGEYFAHKAFETVLDEAGMKEEAQELYDKTLSLQNSSLKDAIEYSYFHLEVRG